MKFPEVDGSNLEYRAFKLPYDFQGVLNIVIISFKRSYQIIINKWISFLNKLVKTYPVVEYYELYTVNRRFKSTRFMIDEGMRSCIPNRFIRERSITLYIRKKQFKKALEIPNEKNVYLFLVKSDGEVIWDTSGSFDDKKGEELRKKINKLTR